MYAYFMEQKKDRIQDGITSYQLNTPQLSTHRLDPVKYSSEKKHDGEWVTIIVGWGSLELRLLPMCWYVFYPKLSVKT